MNYLIIVILCYLSPFLLGGIAYFLFKKCDFQFKNVVFSILVLVTMFFFYSVYIEPSIIVERNIEIDVDFISEEDETLRIALIADPHLGVYKNGDFMERVVKLVNKRSDLDAVLIPGDFYYEPSEDQIYPVLESLSELEVNVFATAGNHDYIFEGKNVLEESLAENLMAQNVYYLKNEVVEFIDYKIVGFGDLWFDDFDPSVLDDLDKEDNVIVLSHNPDTVMDMDLDKVDFVVSGHTHGGQIRIPFLYEHVIPTKYDFDKGYYEEYKLYITSGLGETLLPMRFLVPPEIVYLELK